MYVIIWEYRAKEGRESAFEQIYGPAGDWVRLFQRGEGYLGTDLLRDTATPRRYVTIDRWALPSAYETFRRQWQSDYEALDARCAPLTEQEALLGTFSLSSTD